MPFSLEILEATGIGGEGIGFVEALSFSCDLPKKLHFVQEILLVGTVAPPGVGRGENAEKMTWAVKADLSDQARRVVLFQSPEDSHMIVDEVTDDFAEMERAVSLPQDSSGSYCTS